MCKCNKNNGKARKRSGDSSSRKNSVESHTGRTFPYIATRECPSVGRVLRGGSQCELSYHAGAELLQEA